MTVDIPWNKHMAGAKILLETALDNEPQHLAQKFKSTQITTQKKMPLPDTLHWFWLLCKHNLSQRNRQVHIVHLGTKFYQHTY